MKMLFSFIFGILFCGLLVVGLVVSIPIRAQTDTVESISDNFSLVDLLPDFEKIYREALLTPLNEVKSKIYDEDIANFYDKLLQNTDLDKPEDGTE